MEDKPEPSFLQPSLYQKMKISVITPTTSHAVFGTLLRPGLIERFDCYKRITNSNNNERNETLKDGEQITDDDTEVAVAIIKVGNQLNGHVGI
eukprot:11152580-Ditylum_brightwellii.AAC.1